MAKFYSEINESLREFIAKQKVFFTATAPESGRINLSPKGMDTFRYINSKTVIYLDLTGSGNETAAHLQQTERMTVMFCSFSEQPLILRLYGKGKVIFPRNKEWQTFYPLFNSLPGERQIIVMEVKTAQTSCGFGVPIYEYKQERQELRNWAEKKGQTGIRDYWKQKNQRSIDGLPTNLLQPEK